MKVAVVGAGRGGTNLIKVFQTLSDVYVSVVVDTNSSSEGILYAQSQGISCEKDLSNIGRYGVDLIVEATGSSAVIMRLKELFGDTHQIIDAQVAQVLNKIVDGQVTLLDQMSKQMDGIQKLAGTFAKEFHQLEGSVENIKQLSGQLNVAVENSNQYIAKTGEITDLVNKIAMQTKILGLNANIEAARAGEHGKGFAVVANEVQKLSNSSTQFATEISDLLKELSNEIQMVNDAANQLNSVSQVQNGTADIMKTAMGEIATLL